MRRFALAKVAAKPSERASWSKYVRNFNLFTHPCPYRLALLGTSLRVRGKLTPRKKNSWFLFIYTLLTIFLAGFFAMSHMMFFLPSTFRFYPLLNNDGRGELHLRKAVSNFSPNKRKILIVRLPRLSGSKRTTFRGAERRCKSV